MQDGSAWIVPADTSIEPFVMDAAYMHKHEPHVDGYFVAYDNEDAGWYFSYSPQAPFEKGYIRRIPEVNPIA